MYSEAIYPDLFEYLNGVSGETFLKMGRQLHITQATN